MRQLPVINENHSADMSMMTALRRAFGFAPDTEEEEGDYDPTVPTYAVSSRDADVTPSAAVSSVVSSSVEVKTDDTSAAHRRAAGGDESLPVDLFDAVIELFNRQQPEFVKECLNVDAQRSYIIASISESLRRRAGNALSPSDGNWEREREELLSKIAHLEGGEGELSKLKKENDRLRLSVDRQKRALLDRINDLEAQVTKHDKERENFYSRKHHPEAEQLAKAEKRVKELETQLENAGKQAEEAAARTESLEKKVKELEEARAAAADDRPSAEDMKSLEDKLREAQARLAESEAAKAETGGQMKDLEKECDELREELDRQIKLREQLEVKTSMSDAMINDLRNQAAAARSELESMQQTQETALEQIQAQIEGFEELKARKDARISELQASNASLRTTIETNLYNQANSELKLRGEIKELKAQLAKLSQAKATGEEDASAPATPEASANSQSGRHGKRRGRPKKVRIESDLDNTDWFSPAGGSKHDDPDFGYHEPPRRPVNDNEAQLSLF